MKKLILTMFILLNASVFISQTTNTSKSDAGSAAQTPTRIVDKFNVEYPNNSAMWTREGSYYRAEYLDKKTNMRHKVYYDKNANMIKHQEEMAQGSYPGGVSDYYTRTYPNEKYEVWSSMDADGNRTYYSERNGETIWFDKDGKYKNVSKASKQK